MKKYRVWTTDDRGIITDTFGTDNQKEAAALFEVNLNRIKDGKSGRDVEVTMAIVSRHYHARPELTSEDVRAERDLMRGIPE